VQEETAFAYSPRSVDEHVFENLKISPMQWSRVQAYVKKYSKNEFTANELAEWMQVTDRNARKILNELEKGNFVKIIGEEQPGPKGRPRKVYRVEL
jgi:predicted ArsR family transcriptional regulator